jgi:hypothetical protein
VSPIRLVLIAVAAAVAATSCASDWGGAMHAGERALVPADNAWRLWYLAPPWEVVENTPAAVTLRIPLSAGAVAGAAGTFIALQINPNAGGTPTGALTGAMQDFNNLMMTPTYGPRAFQPLDGGVAPAGLFEAGFASPNETDRIVAGTLANGRTITLRFRGRPDVATNVDITQMIMRFEPVPVTGRDL